MRRSVEAYLQDIVDACDGIALALRDVDLNGYLKDRVVRSAVEREFIIIGEAVSVLARLAPNVAASISHARRIVDFRNQLTHAYPSIEDDAVWAITQGEVPVLRRECMEQLALRDGD